MGFNKGYTPWNKGKERVSGIYERTKEIKDKISKSLLGNIPWNKGKSIGKEKLKEHKSIYRQAFYVKSRFGVIVIELEKFINDYLEKNGPICDICGRVATVIGKVKISGKRRLVVDHDHKSGKIRSIICDFCNVGLRMFGDDADKMKEAIIYLNKFK